MRYAHIRAQFCPAPWFPFCMAWYEKQQNLLLLLIYFTARFEMKFQPSVCFTIIVTWS